MGLRERLQAAEEERRKAAGLPTWGPTDGPTDVAQADVVQANAVPEPPRKTGGPVVDLREPAPVIDLRTTARRREELASVESPVSASGGADPRCPSCGAPGHLDMQDIVGRIDHYSCPVCHSLFQLQR